MEVFRTNVKRDVLIHPSLSSIHNKLMAVQIFNHTAVEQIFHRDAQIVTARPLQATNQVHKTTIVSPEFANKQTMSISQTEDHQQLFPQFYTEDDNNVSRNRTSKRFDITIELNKDNSLSPNGKLHFQELFNRRQRAFVGPAGQLGKCELYEVKVHLKEGAQPLRKRPYRLAPHIQKEAQQQHMTQDKSQLKYRIVVDLRALNSQIVNTTRLVPNPEEFIDRVCQRYTDSTMAPRFFTSLDLKESDHITQRQQTLNVF